MNRRLIVRPEAEADITDGAVWYDSREPGLGLELTSEIDSAIARVLKNPESFPRVRRNPIVRRVLTRRFPYRVFFIVRPDAIVVFAVIHAARHDRVGGTVILQNPCDLTSQILSNDDLNLVWNLTGRWVFKRR